MSLIDRAMQKNTPSTDNASAKPEGTQVTQNTSASMIERAVAQQSAPSSLTVENIQPQPSSSIHQPKRIVQINVDQLRERGLVTPDGANIEITAEFRVIKRPLLENAFSRRVPGGRAYPNTVMISSAVPSEGKSFCAMNLAMSLAMEPDHNVILVDADVHRFTLMRELGIENQLRDCPGLVDLLLDSSLPLEHAIYRTNIDKLSVLPFGQFHARATELFGSRAMQERIDALCSRYAQSMIIFDTPPILVTTETRVLASLLGQVVLIVEAEHTLREKIKEALGYIEGANVIGTILNKTRHKSQHDYYSGYYYKNAA